MRLVIFNVIAVNQRLMFTSLRSSVHFQNKKFELAVYKYSIKMIHVSHISVLLCFSIEKQCIAGKHVTAFLYVILDYDVI